jgi:hypothetical protein
LDTEPAPWIFPLDGAIDAGDLAGAAFQTTSKFDYDLFFLVERVKVCRAGINAEMFFAGMAYFLIKSDMTLFVVFKGIKSEFFGDLHRRNLIRWCHSRENGNPGFRDKKTSGFLLAQE